MCWLNACWLCHDLVFMVLLRIVFDPESMKVFSCFRTILIKAQKLLNNFFKPRGGIFPHLLQWGICLMEALSTLSLTRCLDPEFFNTFQFELHGQSQWMCASDYAILSPLWLACDICFFIQKAALFFTVLFFFVVPFLIDRSIVVILR